MVVMERVVEGLVEEGEDMMTVSQVALIPCKEDKNRVITTLPQQWVGVVYL